MCVTISQNAVESNQICQFEKVSIEMRFEGKERVSVANVLW